MEIIRMSKKELFKGEVIGKAINGTLTQSKASEELQLSLRQIKRLCKRFKNEGLAGLAHKNRGKSNNRKINSKTRTEVLELIKTHYYDFGPQLIKEQLEERHQRSFSREWIRLLMIEEGLWKVKKRKGGRFYQRRNRRSQEGDLLQIDGSPEHWFGEDHPRCCLINMIDDATGKIKELRFVDHENLEGYFQGMHRYIKRNGRPLAVYSDRHTIFKSPKSEDKSRLSQFGRAMKELGIELIHANSPQAKGRVERSFCTLQDRLIKLMRRDEITSMEAGNIYVDKFRLDYNKRFGRLPRSSEDGHRPISDEVELSRILCRKEDRKISKSLTINYNGRCYQLISKNNSRRLVGKRAQILIYEGDVMIECEGEGYDYTIFNDQPYIESVMSRKRIDSFLDKKKRMSIIERHRKKAALSF